MDFVVTIVLVFGVIALLSVMAGFYFAYRKKQPAPLSKEEPKFCWLPKFETAVELPENLQSAKDPVSALGEQLAVLGFYEDVRSNEDVRFARGELKGDFSVQLSRINLSVKLPIEPKAAKFVVTYSSTFTACDTGDLWKFTKELKSKIEQKEDDQESKPEESEAVHTE